MFSIVKHCFVTRVNKGPKQCVYFARAMSNCSNQHFDVIIGGGGLVGTALAATINKNPTLADKKILILEGAPPFKGFKVSNPYGNRVSAINQNSVNLFKSLGIWEEMEEARVKHVKQMQVWDADSDALIKFHHENFTDDVACIIENDLILNSMLNIIKDSPNILLKNSSKIMEIKLPQRDCVDESPEVTLIDGDKFTCDLLIGADGANSLIRQEMGVDVFSTNYDQMGLVATLEVQDAGDNSVAWQRFIPTGPVALLPLSEKYMSLVWSTTEPHAKSLKSMNEEDFIRALNEAFCKEYPKSSLVTNVLQALGSLTRSNVNQLQYPPQVSGVIENSRATFPLGFLHASSYVGHNVALIGDAAHRIHPLAGQGVNLGFSDIVFLVDMLSQAAYAGAKLGDKHYLLIYEQKCLSKNVPIMVGVHGLQALYSTSFTPIVFLRGLGLQITQNLPSIKNMFMKRAMG